MRTSTPIFALSLAATVYSQASSGTSICDFYAAKISTGNTTEAQSRFIEQFVANVFGGNSSVFTGTSVPGVLSAGTYNGQQIRLARYFDGTLYSTQSTTGKPQAVNWMDDGGTVTLSTGRISRSNTSNQYKLLSRFGSLFARVLGCSVIGTANFTTNLGQSNLYQVHKFMALDPNELGYFIEQVGLAGRVIGMTETEASGITTRMSQSLTYRCRQPVAVVPGGPAGPQSICTDKNCPEAPSPDCSAYDYQDGISPEPALVNPAAVPSGSANATAPATPPAAKKKSNIIPIAVGVAVPVGVLLLALIGYLVWRHKRKVNALESRLSRMEGTSTPGYGGFSDKASYVAHSEVTPTIASAGPARQSHATSGSFSDPRTSSYVHQSPETSHPFAGEPFDTGLTHTYTNEFTDTSRRVSSPQIVGSQNVASHNVSVPQRSPSGAVVVRPGQQPQELA